MKKEKAPVRIDLVRGVEGLALYINDYRVCGPKPWGGGPYVEKWEVTDEDMRRALRKGGGK